MIVLCSQLIGSAAVAAPSPTVTSTPSAHGEMKIDPVTDSVILATTLGFGLLLELIVRTGELQPQAPGDSRF